MQLPRKTTASRVVPEIQGEIQSSISPALAASTEQAKWGAFAAGAAAASDIKQVYDNAQTEMEMANDKIQNAIDDGYYKSELDQLKAEHQQRSAAGDPTWSQNLYRENVEALNKTRMDAAKNLTNPKVRANVEKLVTANANITAQEARIDAIDMDATRAYNSFEKTYNTAIEEEDYDFAMHLLKTAMDTSDGTPIIDPIKGQAAESKLNKLIKTKELTDFSNEWQQRYIDNPEEAITEYGQILKSNMPSDEKKQLEALMQGAKYRADVAINFEKSEQNDAYNQKKTEAILDIETSRDPEYSSVDQILQADWGEGNAAAVRKLEVVRALTRRAGSDSNKLNYSARLESGIPTKDSEANREALDAYIRDQITEDMTPEEIQIKTMEAINLAGYPTQQMVNSLKAGPRSPSDMKRQYGLWKGLTTGEKKLNLHMEDKEYSDYGYIDALTEYDMSAAGIDQAIEQWWQKKDSTLKTGNMAWKEKVFDGKTRTGQEVMQRAWEEVSTEGRFKEGWLSPENGNRNVRTNLELYKRFMDYTENQIGVGATPETAKFSGAKFIENIGGSTNINGRYEKQMNLPPGTEEIDMRHLKDKAVGVKDGFTGLYSGVVPVVEVMENGDRSVTNKKVLNYTTANDVAIPVDGLDESKVRMYVPLDKRQARTPDGDVVFEIYYEGTPLIAVTEKGSTPVKVSFTQDELIDEKVEKKDHMKELSEAEAELRKLQEEQEKRAGESRTSGLNVYGTRNLETTTKDKEDLVNELTRQQLGRDRVKF